MDLHSGSRTKASSIFQATKPGSSVNIGLGEKKYYLANLPAGSDLRTLAATIKANLPMIKHVQLADNPGRFEPGTGEINYHYLLPMLDEIGYEGWVGCEYKPKAGTVEGLGWRAAHQV